MKFQIVRLSTAALFFVAAPCGAANPSLDESIAAWSARALSYAERVTDPEQRRGELALVVATIHAQQGNGRKAVNAAREVREKPQQNRLAMALAPYLTEQEALEIVEALPTQTAKDEALRDFAFTQALGGHYDIAERFVCRMSADLQTKGWVGIAGAQEFKKEYRAALGTLDKAKPPSEALRNYLDRLRNKLRHRLAESDSHPRDAPSRRRDLESQLATATREAQAATSPDDQGLAWLKQAHLQRELGEKEESRKSLTRAEDAAEKTPDASLRASALTTIVKEY